MPTATSPAFFLGHRGAGLRVCKKAECRQRWMLDSSTYPSSHGRRASSCIRRLSFSHCTHRTTQGEARWDVADRMAVSLPNREALRCHLAAAVSSTLTERAALLPNSNGREPILHFPFHCPSTKCGLIGRLSEWPAAEPTDNVKTEKSRHTLGNVSKQVRIRERDH